MSPLSPAYFAFAAIAITLYWACYRWKYARLSILLLANIFFVAGPINRISDLIKELQQPFSLTSTQGGRAFLLISSGLFKKLLIADFLANNVANRIFDTPTLYSGAEVLIGVYAYALQIYFDFS